MFLKVLHCHNRLHKECRHNQTISAQRKPGHDEVVKRDGETERKKICVNFLSVPHTHTTAHPIFVVHHVAQHVIQVQNASISMFQPVDLDPVAGVLEEEEEEKEKKN